jgi:23S rRNA (guanosine2251-2'-O)-methyltransferase
MDPNFMMKVVGPTAPARGVPPTNPLEHRTCTVDYAIIMSGEIDMMLDDKTVHLKAVRRRRAASHQSRVAQPRQGALSRHLRADGFQGAIGPREFLRSAPGGSFLRVANCIYAVTKRVMRERKWQPKTKARRGLARGRDRSARREPSDQVILYGWHTVTAALTNPQRRIRRLLATENALGRLADEGINVSISPEVMRPDALAARLTPDAVHQGLIAEADPLPSPAIENLPASGIVLVLDQITDPHNVGAILRTAAAFAVAAVVTTARHSPEATGVLAKSASGALELVPIVIVQNLARALTGLKARGFLTVGLDSEATDDLAAIEMNLPLALVLGAEGKGLRQLTGATCDRLARLDLPGAIKSLNVSNAAALALYIASRATS